jgi:hypothetical protein
MLSHDTRLPRGPTESNMLPATTGDGFSASPVDIITFGNEGKLTFHLHTERRLGLHREHACWKCQLPRK